LPKPLQHKLKKEQVVNDVTLKLDGPKITAEKFKKAVDAFLDIISSVGKQVVRENDSLSWLITVESGSAVFHAKPESKSGNPYFEERASKAVVEGIRILETDPDQEPPNFTDKAMERVKDLASVQDRKGEFVSSVTVFLNGETAPVSPKIAIAVDHFLGIERTEIGSITGELRSITDFGGVYFYIWDVVTGHRVRCDISEELLPTAMAAFRKRVSAYGLIHYDRKERPRRIAVEEIHTFKTEGLPKVDDVIGLFSEEDG
jgi:hypothetical protein